MTTYMLYGTKMSIGEAKNILQNLFDNTFVSRESGYQYGEHFRYGEKSKENFELKRNIDPFDDDPIEMKFPEFQTLLYINNTTRPHSLNSIMTKVLDYFLLLRQEDF